MHRPSGTNLRYYSFLHPTKRPDCPRDRCTWERTPPDRPALRRVVLSSIPLKTPTFSDASPVVFKGRDRSGTLLLDLLQQLFPLRFRSFAIVEKGNQLYDGPRFGCSEERACFCEKEIGVVLHQPIVVADARIIAFPGCTLVREEDEVKMVVGEKKVLRIGGEKSGNKIRIQRIDYRESDHQHSRENIRKGELLFGILDAFKNRAAIHDIRATRSTDSYIIPSSAARDGEGPREGRGQASFPRYNGVTDRKSENKKTAAIQRYRHSLRRNDCHRCGRGTENG